MDEFVSILWFVPVVYAATSITLLIFPNLLHRKKEHRFHPTHISHRGGAGERPENTLAAFQNAIDNGTEMFELDVHMTADGEVVVIHDPHLLRITGHAMDVCDVKFSDLPPLKHKIEVTFDTEHMEHHTQEQIPRLVDVFTTFPETPMNIDLKGNDEKVVEKVAELIRQHKREHLTVWGSPHHHVHKICETHHPEVSRFFSVRSILLLYVYFYTGLLPFMHIKENFLEIPMPASLHSKNTSKTKHLLTKALDFVTMNRVLFSHLKRRGVKILVWVTNEPEAMDRAFQLGADGVMTDYPSKLAAYLNEKVKTD